MYDKMAMGKAEQKAAPTHQFRIPQGIKTMAFVMK